MGVSLDGAGGDAGAFVVVDAGDAEDDGEAPSVLPLMPGSIDCDTADASSENSGIDFASTARSLPLLLSPADLDAGCSYLVDHRSTWR